MKMLATVQLQAGTDRVTVRDIPTLIADAIHGARCDNDDPVSNDDLKHTATVQEYEKAVKHAVMHGKLVPRNSMTLTPMPDAVGRGMLDGIVTIPDLSAFLAQFDIGLTELFEVRGIKGTSTMSRAGYDEHLQRLAQRQAKGRYSMDEAAIAVNKATGERADEMLHKFMKAAFSGLLRTYEPGKDSQYLYGEGFATFTRDRHEEAYWCDLNKWLDENEARITWRFPEPESRNATDGLPVGAGDAPVKSQTADFLTLSKLLASEVSITFVAGESGGVILEVSAREVTRRIALAELNLFDRRKGEMNTQGGLLLGLAQGQRIVNANVKTAKQIGRLRVALKSSLGIKDDPIPNQSGAGYLPRVKIFDKRNAANVRAKREAKMRTVSLDELQSGGIQFAANTQRDSSYENEDEMNGDAADTWLKGKTE